MTPSGLRRAVDTAVLLPGTGSDEVFVASVFAGPLADVGLAVEAPRPTVGAALAERQLAALDAAADRHGVIITGGISFGAHLAAEWAAANPDRCGGLLLAMPGWHGPPADAPGSLAARLGADAVDADGIDRALAAASSGVPAWLARELDRSWRRSGAGLAESLRVAARRPAPTLRCLAGITAPAGLAGCVDDAVHPLAVARAWARALPRAALRTITFADLGADPAALGRAALAALVLAQRGGMRDQVGDDDRGHDDRRGDAEHER
ncbi:MAG TPA: alpha/beta hydrolase [Pseudonocardiaceae bacterium]